MAAEPIPADPSRAALALRALRHRNFRIFTLGQSLSLIGTWMQQVAIGWLVYRLTGSAFLLGVVGFMSQGPGFVLAPFAGEFADRYSRHRIVIATQTVMMVQALLLGALVLTDNISVGWILVLMGVLGAASGFDIPARQSFLIEMVGDRDDLPNAIALNSSIFNAARLVGPAIAGFAIAAVGEGWVILANGISYIFVLAGLLSMRLTPRPRQRGRGAVFRRVQEGFRYAYRFQPIRSILVLVAVVSLMAVPFSILLPVIATDVLGGGPRTLGLLMSAMGLGALTGALFLASRSTVVGLGRLIVVAATLFGTALVLLSFARSVAVALPLIALAGFGMMTQMASSNTVLQTLVDDDKRGRVMSLYTMAFTGTAPIGSLLIGWVAGLIGAPTAIAIGGAFTVAAGLLFGSRLPVLRGIVRPIYARMGILPEVARGIQAATHNTTPAGEDEDRDDDEGGPLLPPNGRVKLRDS
ncbi:MAG TPA: MFS transporter [Longimicrobiales bacterium]|nr:MFS transporter [Longimicrobiales bacterium]